MSNDSPQRILEVQVLSAAWRDKDAREIIVKNLSTYEFQSETLTWIWNTLLDIHKRGEQPRADSVMAMVCAAHPLVKPQLYEDFLEVVRSEHSTSPKTDCGILLKYQAHHRLVQGMDRASKTMISGDVDGARDVLSKAVNDTSTTDATGLKPVSLIDWDEWNRQPVRVKGIPLGIKDLDDELMGGASRGELVLTFGTTGMGKSILGINVGHSALKHRFKVLHIDSENGDDLVRCRYVARLLNLKTKALQRRMLQNQPWIHEWAQANKERLDRQLRIMGIGVGQSKLPEVKAQINNLVSDGFVPDLVVFDSPDHILMDSGDNVALVYKLLYEQLKGMAQEFNAVVFAVTQAGKEAEGKIATSKNIAWGYDKARIADIILTINPPVTKQGTTLAESKMGDNRSLYVAKVRSSASRFLIRMKASFQVAKLQQDLGTADGCDEEDEDA